MLLPFCAISENLLNTPLKGTELASVPDDDDGGEFCMIISWEIVRSAFLMISTTVGNTYALRRQLSKF